MSPYYMVLFIKLGKHLFCEQWYEKTVHTAGVRDNVLRKTGSQSWSDAIKRTDNS